MSPSWHCTSCNGQALEPHGERFDKRIWKLGSYRPPGGPLPSFDIALRIDQKSSPLCLQLVFLEEFVGGLGRKKDSTNLGYVLIETKLIETKTKVKSRQHHDAFHQDDNPPTEESAEALTLYFRGMEIIAKYQKMGLSKLFLAVFLRFCFLVCGQPATRPMKKPLLIAALEDTFGFEPASRQVPFWLLRPSTALNWLEKQGLITGIPGNDSGTERRDEVVEPLLVERDAAERMAPASLAFTLDELHRPILRQRGQRTAAVDPVRPPLENSGMEVLPNSTQTFLLPNGHSVSQETVFCWSRTPEKMRSVCSKSYQVRQNIVLLNDWVEHAGNSESATHRTGPVGHKELVDKRELESFLLDNSIQLHMNTHFACTQAKMTQKTCGLLEGFRFDLFCPLCFRNTILKSEVPSENQRRRLLRAK